MTGGDVVMTVGGWLWTHGMLAFSLSLIAAGLVVLVRVGHLVALAYADLRLRWRAGSALGHGGLVEQLVGGGAGGAAPLAHGRGERSLFYEVYMQSDSWRARRARTLMLAGGACQSCGAKATDAHHLTYERLGREHDGDLAALCPTCHRAAHATSRTGT